MNLNLVHSNGAWAWWLIKKMRCHGDRLAITASASVKFRWLGGNQRGKNQSFNQFVASQTCFTQHDEACFNSHKSKSGSSDAV